jgi:hypothetical protein
MRRIIARSAALVLVLAVSLAGAAAGRADEPLLSPLEIGFPPSCGSEVEVTLSAVECAGIEPVEALGPVDPAIERAAAETASAEFALVAAQGPGALRRNCRLHSEVAVYTANDWRRLGETLAGEATHCADYYISIPPVTDKTVPRAGEAGRIRALGPRFHAMAEAHLASWQAWVAAASGRTWLQAGQEFRRRMAAAGYDVGLGDLWAMNEVPSSVRQNAGQSRRNLLDFLRGLYEGDGTAPTKGLVFVSGFSQRTQVLSVYLSNMRAWLADGAFWTEAGNYTRFWAQEVYGDVRSWGVPGTPLMTRSQHQIDYLLHPLFLARAGGDSSRVAETFLRDHYVSLANAAWRWRSGFGNTDVDDVLMRHYLSEQVHAIRHDAGTHPADGPEGRFGFAWAQQNLGLPAPAFVAATAGLQQRLASALAESYAQGGSSQMGACGPPGDHVWCEGVVEGAAFNEGWSVFSEPWNA